MYRGHVFIPIQYYFTLPFCMSMTLHNTLSLCLIVHKWNIIILWHSRIRTDLTLSRKFRSEKWYCSSLNIAGICIWTTNYLIHYKVDNRTYLTNIKCICSNVPCYRTSFLSQELKASSSRSDWCIWKYDIHNLQFCIAPVYTKTKSFQYDRRTKQCKKYLNQIFWRTIHGYVNAPLYGRMWWVEKGATVRRMDTKKIE